MKNIIFFLGKGGTGKTTSSVGFAYYLVDQDKSVYLASIDPAHNIGDIISNSNLKGPTNIYKGLYAEEIDTEFYLKQFINTTTKRMKETYKYLQIINLDSMLDIMKYSPGMEEYAIMYALKDKIESNLDKDYIIIDTPPTGLMLKIFALPITSKMWIDRLIKWRKKIIQTRGAIKNINPKAIDDELAITEEDDKVLKELGLQSQTVEFLLNLLRDKNKTKTVIITNEDSLSLSESKRIIEGLNHLSIPLNLIVLNKKGLMNKPENLENHFNVDMVEVPFIENATNIENIKKLCQVWAKRVLDE
ncbi:ArsA family ATPase [Hippea sp. KM1]|uniref:ArsA family ATPase n=1 Tax=Hippea sp. KM1 TaxID=944481 RepID=UPI00046D7BED|nr:TRC40/GET3/ArsA family transport-energizing ATPase [Hippea sp. KM1]